MGQIIEWILEALGFPTGANGGTDINDGMPTNTENGGF